jgi:hypothetical protein
MKHVHQFDHRLYHKALEGQIGRGLPVFTGYRQRGAGLGSIIGLIGRYVLPIIQEHVLPHAKTALVNTVKDIIKGAPVKEALLRQGGDMLQKVATGLEKRQTGSGLKIKKRPAPSKETSVAHVHSPSKQSKKSTRPKKTKKSRVVSKRDIWDGVNQ